MGILKHAWKPVAALAVVTQLSGCMEPLPAETPREADYRVRNTVATGAALACGSIKDYRKQLACFAAAAAGANAAGAHARNQAAQAGSCTQTRSGRVGANNPVYENCTRRTPW